MRWWGRQRSVTAGRDIDVAVTGDHNHIQLASPVCSAYWEQVRRIAPPELVERERELAELAAFCTAESGPSYAWWRAEAWAGKTALMSWFALRPPQGVRIVPFFVTARLGAQNDVVAYVDVVLEQLAELAGEGLPAHLTAATREAHLLHLYGAAARTCTERGERLVLLVDGLDEDRGVTTGPDAHSIASLLPARPEAGMRVLVAGRLNPPLPGDLPGLHPLHNPAVVRTLPPSPYAQAIRTEAERELKELIQAGGLEYDLLALVTAAGGGLTADDLAELTEVVPYRVRDVLRTRAGRTFGLRGTVYLLGHEELQSQAEEMLGATELDRYRGKLHEWADGWRERGWPEGTPEYLSRGYFRTVREGGDVDRMVALATDDARHHRMLVLTGGDASALSEVHSAGHLVLERGTDLPWDSLRLAMHGDRLRGRGVGIPESLPWAWAVVGRPDRALALARSLSDEYRRGIALNGVAGELQKQGVEERTVVDIVDEAVEQARRCPPVFGDVVLARAVRLFVEAGQHEKALAAVREVHRDALGAWSFVRLVEDWAAIGRWDLAEALIRDETEAECAERMKVAMVSALARAERPADAEALARSLSATFLPSALIVLATAARESGALRRAEDLYAEAESMVVTSVQVRWAVEDLVGAGEFDRAIAVARRRGAAEYWRGGAAADLVGHLARAGELDRVEELAGELDPQGHSDAWHEVCAARAGAGRFEEAEALARRIPRAGEADRALRRIAESLAEAGEFDRAVSLTRGIVHRGRRSQALRGVARALAQAGEFDRAQALCRTFEEPRHRAEALVGVVGALAAAGRVEEATDILRDIEPHLRAADEPTALWRLGRAAAALSVSGGHHAVAEELLAGVEEMIPDRLYGRDGLELFHEHGTVGSIVGALVDCGQLERAEALALRVSDESHRGDLLMQVVRGWAVTGAFERAEALVDAATDAAVLLETVLARAMAEAGAFDRAEEVIRTRAPFWSRVSELCRLAEAMARAGHPRARDLADELSPQVSVERPGASGRFALARVRIAQGERDAALSLLETSLLPEPLAVGDWTNIVEGAGLLVALGRHEEAVRHLHAVSDSPESERARCQAAVVEALVEARQFGLAEDLASSMTDGETAARACACIAAATPDLGHARRLTALALQSGGWIPALPALIQRFPDAVPLVAEEALGLKAACRGGRRVPTAARTSAPSSK